MKHSFGQVNFSQKQRVAQVGNNLHYSTQNSSLLLEHRSDLTHYEDENFIIQINGDIYQGTLESFITALKSEGILKALKIFSSVYTLTLIDKKKQKLYCSRDHLGIYPLYYYHKDDTFLFSNDLHTFRDVTAFEKK